MSKFTILIIFISVIYNVCYANQSHRDSIDVHHYTINLKINDFKNKKIIGFTKIKCTPVFDSTEHISFDLKELNVKSVYKSENRIDFNYNKEKITIKLDKMYQKSDTLYFTIYYDGQPVQDDYWGGFIFSDTDAFNLGVGMAAVPPAFGRVWFPCNDSFTDKATYTYNITVKTPLEAVCCGILSNIAQNNDNTTTYTWQMQHEIPTYLSSVAVSDYKIQEWSYTSISGRDFPLNVFYKANRKDAEFKAFKNLNKAMEAFEHYFGAFVWDRQGFVEVSFRRGGMEHATNVAISENAFDNEKYGEMLIVHELAHSWFGNYVTCKNPREMWLNEGWASYCEVLFKEYYYGKQAAKDYRRQNLLSVLKNVHIWDGGYYAVQGIPADLTYSSTVYDKGSEVVGTLRGYVGDEVFFKATKKYLSKYAFKNADSQDLKMVFEEVAGVDLDDFFNFWVYNQGFPHYFISEFKSEMKGNNYITSFKINQTRKGTVKLPESNKVDIWFIDREWNMKKETLEFSKSSELKSIKLDFKPEMIVLDPEEKISDARVDCYKNIKKEAIIDFPHTNLYIDIKKIKTDSVPIQLSQHFDDPRDVNNTMLESLTESYYSVNTIDDIIKGELYIDISDKLKKTSKYKIRDIKLYYRSVYSDEWEEIDFKIFNNKIVTKLQSGDYYISK